MSDQHPARGKQAHGPRSTQGRAGATKQPRKDEKGAGAVKKASVIIWFGHA